MVDLRPLTDEELLARLDALVRLEREAVAEVIEHLVEVERREIVVDNGYTSLFDYCVKKLGYAEQAAYGRIRAARAAQSFPELIEQLRSGCIHLDAVVRIYPHLTEENKDDLLERASGATTREVLRIVAEFEDDPRPQRDVIRPVPGPKPVERLPLFEAVTAEIIPPPPRMRFEFTADDDLVVIVERLRSLLRHKYPDGGLEHIFREAAQALLARIDPTRPKREPAGGAMRTKSRSRRIPQAVKDEVWKPDEGQCPFVSAEGRRCGSKDFLEYDHIVPWASGGRSDTPDNIRLLCRPHNQRLARKRFGPRRRLPKEPTSRA